MFDDLRILARDKLETRGDEGSSKVMPMPEALRKFVRPGMLIHLGSTPGRSTCSIYELMRQHRGQKPDFGVIVGGFNTPTGFAALVRAGLLKKVISAYAGAVFPNPSPSPVCQAAFADRTVEFEHWTLLTLALRLKAAAMGLPFATTKSLVGSGMERDNTHAFRAVDDPFNSGQRVGLVRALHPDISLVHGLAADRHGNTIIAPPWGDNTWGAMAAREGAVVTVERIVPTDVIRRLNHFGRLPGYFVRSVSEVPFGAHPTALHNQWVEGIDGYTEDYEFLIESRKAELTMDGLDAWLEQWVYSVNEHQKYLDKVGFQRLLFLRGKAQWDSYRQELESAKATISDSPEFNSVEHMVAISSRIIAQRAQQRNYKTILAGIGAANLAAWLANAKLKGQGIDVDLMAETGFYGYWPRPCDPFIFNHRNIYTCKALSDIEHVLGIFASGANNRCLGSLGAAQVDKRGNINTTLLSEKRLLMGSGGANDVASGCREIVVAAAQSRNRFLDELPFVTSPGRAVSTLVSNLGVFEKLGEDTEFTLTGYLARLENLSADDAVRKINEQCGWELRVADDLERHEPASLEELRIMRIFDPQGQFLSE